MRDLRVAVLAAAVFAPTYGSDGYVADFSFQTETAPERLDTGKVRVSDGVTRYDPPRPMI